MLKADMMNVLKNDYPIWIAIICGCMWINAIIKQMHPIKPKGLSLGLGFQFFEYLGFGLGILQIPN